MQYYHDTENVKSYVAMCEGYDAAAQLEMLYRVLSDGSTILELGSGSGNDLELLASHYNATGSDYSPAFVDLLKTRLPNLPILTLDAMTIATEGPFDAIYSNKVMHHLKDDELKTSFQRQAKLLRTGGLVFHLVWRQLEAPKEDFGLIFKERNLAAVEAAMGGAFELLESKAFGEFEDEDSLAILARKI